MTSMLLTARSGRGVASPNALTSLPLRAVAPRVADLLALITVCRLDLRPDDVAHRREPVRDAVPLLAVPLMDEHGAAPLVILARHLPRLREALHADLVEALVGEVEVLEAPADLFAGERFVAELRHRGADGLGREHRVDDAAVVERRTHLFFLSGALSLVVDVLEDLRVRLEVDTWRVERRALVAFRPLAGRDDVGVVGRPPVADETVHLEADGRRFLDRDLVHDAPARHEDPVRIQPSHLEPRRLLLLPGMVHREQCQLELVLPRELLERRVRLLPVGAVVEDVGDLLALQLLDAALLLTDVANDGRRLAPVVRREVEHPRETPADGGGAHAIPHREDHHLVDGSLGDQRVGDRGAVGIHEHGALPFEPFVALDALLVVVLRLALFPRDLDAVDPAVALVQEREVVDEAVGDRNTARRVRPGPVDEQWDEHLLRLGDDRHRRRDHQRRQHRDRDDSYPHDALLFTHAQWGNGQSRSFSFVICQSRARPRGSTIRKKMISQPKTISSICFWSATCNLSPY